MCRSREIVVLHIASVWNRIKKNMIFGFFSRGYRTVVVGGVGSGPNSRTEQNGVIDYARCTVGEA